MTRCLKTHPGTTILAIFALACMLYAGTGDFLVDDRPDIRMALPDRLGNWTGEDVLFCQEESCLKLTRGVDISDLTQCPSCGGELDFKALGENTVLPADVDIVRKFYTHDDNRAAMVTLVAGGRERESIHRPQRCLIAQGLEILGSRVRKIPVPHREQPLSVMVLKTIRHSSAGRPGAGHMGTGRYFAYWFAGQGRETPYHLERMFWMGCDRLFAHRISRWAYISVSGRRAHDSDSYLRDLSDLVALLLPAMDASKTPEAGHR